MIRLVLFLLLFVSNGYAQHVYFGERDLSRTAVCFDFEGNIYPPFFISDSEMSMVESRLSIWYETHPEKKDSVIHLLNLDHSASISKINDELFQYYFNAFTKNDQRSPLFLVHGFRKSFHETDGDVSSVTEFERCKETVDPRFLPVEIYWDGFYDCCFSMNKKKNTELFELFEQAYSNASNVASTLARNLSKLPTSTIQLVGHSLGGKIVLEAASLKSNPNQNWKVVAIAPAMDTKLLSLLSFQQTKLLILHNEQDFVLLKKDNKLGWFGPGVDDYGSTRLGCNYKNELNILSKTEKFKSILTVVDCSDLGKNHSWRVYIREGKMDLVNAWLNSGQ